MNFQDKVYEEVKKLFPEGALEVFVDRPTMPGEEFKQYNLGVKIRHKQTGITSTCSDYESQPQNYVVAAVGLRIACDNFLAGKK